MHSYRYRAHPAGQPERYEDNEAVIEYDLQAPHPQVRRIDRKMASYHGQKLSESAVVRDWKYARLPAREFTLDYYDLGDFERPQSQASAWTTTAVFLASGAALVAGLLVSRWRRSARRGGVPA